MFFTLFYRNRYFLWATILVLVIVGLWAAATIPYIEDPRVTTRLVTIITKLPGATATRVEALITEPIVRKMQRISEIKRIDGFSQEGVSIVFIRFLDEATKKTVPKMFLEIRDDLKTLKPDMPPEAIGPYLDEDRLVAVASTIIFALTWEGVPDEAPLNIMQRFADYFADQIRTVRGTDLVAIRGGVDPEIVVQMNPFEANQLALSAEDLSGIIKKSGSENPSGFLRGENYSYSVEVQGEIRTLDRILNIPIVKNDRGALLRVEDIATADKSYRQPPDTQALYNGKRSVLIAVRTEQSVRVGRWISEIHEIVERVSPLTGGNLSLNVVYDQTRYTIDALKQLSKNLALGAVVVMLVATVFMGWKTGLIVGMSLPLCVAFTLFAIRVAGGEINQASIVGMIIAIGLLIDNAIVISDTIRHEIHHGDQVSRSRILYESLKHLFVPLFAATMTTSLAFGPIYLMIGDVGDFVRPIAFSVIASLIASFFIAIPIIGTLVAIYTRKKPKDRHCWWRDGIYVEMITARFSSVLQFFVGKAPYLGIALSIAPAVVGFLLIPLIGNAFFPLSERNQLLVDVYLDNAASQDKTVRVVEQIDRFLRDEPKVLGTSWVIGSNHPPIYYNHVTKQESNPKYAQGALTLATLKDVSDLIAPLQNRVDELFPEAQVVIRRLAQGPTILAPLGFRIYGPNIGKLIEYGEQVRAIMAEHPEVTHTFVEMSAGKPKLKYYPDEDKVRLAGLTLVDIADQLDADLEGKTGGVLREGVEQMPVRVRYANKVRENIEHIESNSVFSPSLARGWIPMEALGNFKLDAEVDKIGMRGGTRKNLVSGYTLQDSYVLDVSRELLKTIESRLKLSPGYFIEPEGDVKKQGEAIENLLANVFLISVLQFATLILSLSSIVLFFIVGAVVVGSVGMGALSLWVTGFPIGFMVILGAMGLTGVAINGSIVILSFIRENKAARDGSSEAIVEAVLTTTRHILATSITTIGGLLPLIIFVGGSFWPPLAYVMAGGVAFSMMLALIFTPCAYKIICRWGW